MPQEFCRMISLKLNSFFLMPFCEMLPKYMRRSLSRIEREQVWQRRGNEHERPRHLNSQALDVFQVRNVYSKYSLE
eukprot:5413935-Pleurochrysis_carterae.AAC.1